MYYLVNNTVIMVCTWSLFANTKASSSENLLPEEKYTEIYFIGANYTKVFDAEVTL